MTLKRAIRLLTEEYERSKKLEFVRNPLAHALYHVWRIADNQPVKEKSKHERNDP